MADLPIEQPRTYRRSRRLPQTAARWQYVVPFAVLCLGWVYTSRIELSEVRAQATSMPERRDREIDALERRFNREMDQLRQAAAGCGR